MPIKISDETERLKYKQQSQYDIFSKVQMDKMEQLHIIEVTKNVRKL